MSANGDDNTTPELNPRNLKDAWVLLADGRPVSVFDGSVKLTFQRLQLSRDDLTARLHSPLRIDIDETMLKGRT